MKYTYDKLVKTGIKSIVIPVDIYKCNIEILMPMEAEIVTKRWNQDIDCGAITNDYLANGNMVLIRLYSNTDENLVHELTHAAQMIMSHIGHNHCQDKADEPFAYLVGYLFKKAKEGIKKYKKKERKKVDKKKKA